MKKTLIKQITDNRKEILRRIEITMKLNTPILENQQIKLIKNFTTWKSLKLKGTWNNNFVSAIPNILINTYTPKFSVNKTKQKEDIILE